MSPFYSHIDCHTYVQWNDYKQITSPLADRMYDLCSMTLLFTHGRPRLAPHRCGLWGHFRLTWWETLAMIHSPGAVCCQVLLGGFSTSAVARAECLHLYKVYVRRSLNILLQIFITIIGYEVKQNLLVLNTWLVRFLGITL